MGQGESKNSSPSSFVRKESTRVPHNANTGSNQVVATRPAGRRSVQLTEKEKKKLQQLQQKAEAKRSKQFTKEMEKEEGHDRKSGRERAATKIQAAMRGTLGRRKFAKFSMLYVKNNYQMKNI